jgi:hypothetical protein
MSLLQELDKAQARRRFPDWQPKPTSASYKPEDQTVEATIHRLLDFSDLEITVGEWILASATDDSVKEHVERNSKDELKHDEALSYLKSYVGYEAEHSGAQELIERWRAEEPTFALAYALEMGIFMSILPWLNKNGDVYCSTVSNWISDDETVHVVCNSLLAKHLGQKLTVLHFTLVRDTLAYIYDAYGTAFVRTQVERAFRRLTTGKDNAMMDESVPTTPAFFEQNNKRTTEY